MTLEIEALIPSTDVNDVYFDNASRTYRSSEPALRPAKLNHGSPRLAFSQRFRFLRLSSGSLGTSYTK